MKLVRRKWHLWFVWLNCALLAMLNSVYLNGSQIVKQNRHYYTVLHFTWYIWKLKLFFFSWIGRITSYLPAGGPFTRMDSHVYPDYVVPPSYDSLLGKVDFFLFTVPFSMYLDPLLYFFMDMYCGGTWVVTLLFLSRCLMLFPFRIIQVQLPLSPAETMEVGTHVFLDHPMNV